MLQKSRRFRISMRALALSLGLPGAVLAEPVVPAAIAVTYISNAPIAESVTMLAVSGCPAMLMNVSL